MNYQQNSTNRLSGASLFMLIVLAVITAAVTVFGCGWPGTSHSVRFNSFQSERDMARLPPQPPRFLATKQKMGGWDDDRFDYDEYTSSEDGLKKLDSLWERAETAERDGNLSLDRDLLNEYLKVGVAPGRRNSATDRLDALNSLAQGSSAIAVKAYLDARRVHDAAKPVWDAAEIERGLDSANSDRHLKDNVAYLKAAEQYCQENFAEAAAAFKALAEKYPRSEKREAALFLTAVATMKTSTTYVPEAGNWDDDNGVRTKIDPDEAWHEAFAGFQQLVKEYPRGKYFNDARGWQAYLMLRRRDRVGALTQYFRLLADPDESARREAKISLTLVGLPPTDEEMSRLEKDLADEPQAALSYAYYVIYNYSIDWGYSSPPYEEVKDYRGNYDPEATRARNDELEKKWRVEKAERANKELSRTLEFSKRLMTNYPGLAVGGAFALRAAQASEELGDNGSAIKFAQKALQSGLTGEERAQALWTMGVAQYRVPNYDEARRNLFTLLHDYPNINLIEKTRRLLAMISEDAGDIDGALDQYVALGYDIDEAYFVDTLMTPEQLSAFIEKHPDSPKKNEFTYALGLRYLRANRWEDARKTFAQVRTGQESSYDFYCTTCNCEGNAYANCTDPKEKEMGAREDETGKKQVSSALLLRDVQTANDLEALERAANEAVGDEAKAEALYQYASYQYEASSLLFYNPLASPGYANLGEFAGYSRYRAANESQVLFASTQEHERLARALKIYLEVAQKFPRTRAARDALYTAAVCHERLSNYNPYWRLIYENGMHAGQRMVGYADVKATYPGYQLPQGTYGWEPSTRTVNNGPGWAPPPQPPPKPKRLTKRERVRLFVNEVTVRATAFWQEKGKRWLTESLIVFVLVFTMRLARRNQRRLRARIARKRIEQSRQVVTYPWFDWFWIDPVEPSRREQIRNFLGAKRQEFVDLASDRRSRPVLLRSIVSHSAVTGLVVSLIWMIWFG